jgi:histidine triad (HIT) family protein
MYNHVPNKYICPFCLIVAGVEDKHVQTKQKDIFYRDENLTVFISSHWWPNNPGHVIIVCNQHYENIYDIPDPLLEKMLVFAKKIAVVLKKAYKCNGVSIHQHNEPAGNQDVWHMHIAVFPRYKNDNLYMLHKYKKLVAPEERLRFSNLLKKYFK